MPVGDALRALLRELRARFPAESDPREIEIWLASMGYDPRQIETIRTALEAEGGDGDGASGDAGSRDDGPADAADDRGATPAGDAPPALRVAAPYERARFAPEAWGYLLQLRAAGVTGVEFEQLVDRALLHLDGRIGLEELRAVLDGPAGEDAFPSASRTLH